MTAPTEAKPWLDYSGQDTSQIIACKDTHRLDSLLCAMEQGLSLRESEHPEHGLTTEERTFLAIMALDREVNNGGYDQFFVNSSREYTPEIVDALRRVGCETVASVTAKAIAALKLEQATLEAVEAAIFEPDGQRDEALDACDQEFYSTFEIEPNLFAFLESNQQRFRIEKAFVPPPPPVRGLPNLGAVCNHLQFTEKTDFSFDAVRRLAAELAAREKIAAAANELDGAAYLYLFDRSLRSGDLPACELLADGVFEAAREGTMYCVHHKEWLGKLIAASKLTLADAESLRYLEYLAGQDKSEPFIWNRIKFLAGIVLDCPTALPRSSDFIRSRFAEIHLEPARKN